MASIRLLVPGNIRHRSGGNIYNARLAEHLAARGIRVSVEAVDGDWPVGSAEDRRRLATALADAEDDVLIVDGLMASGSPEEIEAAVAAGAQAWVLVHMPLADHPSLERGALHAATGVICTSSSAANEVQDRHQLGRVNVVLPGTDPADPAPGSANAPGRPAPPHFIAAGALLPNKDQALLVEALARLQDLEWTAALTGSTAADPAYAGLVKDAIAAHGLQERVQLTGELSKQDFEEQWQAADLSLLISRTEAFGMVVTESIAHGIPVVVRAGTGATEALGLGVRGRTGTTGTGAEAPGERPDAPAELPGIAVDLTDGPAALEAVLRTWLGNEELRTRWRNAALESRPNLPRWEDAAARVIALTMVQNGRMRSNLPASASLTRELLRAWAWHRQGLDGSLSGAGSEEVLNKAGWARSVGGGNPYLTLFARAGMRREQVDADVAALRIHELPTARGCTYVLGQEHFAWGLQLGRAAAQEPFKVLARLGVERGEITLLEEEILHALEEAGEPLDPKQLRDQLGESVRGLGEEGKRKGASTTLPTALGLLQAAGRIRRIPVNGRLDQQRYAYTTWDLPPSTVDDDAARALLMERYLRWTGGATLKESQWFTGFTVAQSKQALADVGAVEVPAASGEVLWLRPDDVERLSEFDPPAEEQIQLLAGTDSLVLLRRNSGNMFAEEDEERKVLGATLALQADLTDHPILDRGRIIGLWQYDPFGERIAAWTFSPPTQAVAQRIEEVEAWIREDLGDFRSFSLDSPASRLPRIEALDAAAQDEAAAS